MKNKKKIAALILIAAVIMACNFPLLPKVKLPGFLGEITVPSMSSIVPMFTLTLPAMMKSLEPQITIPAPGSNSTPQFMIPGMPTQAVQPQAGDDKLTRQEIALSTAEVVYPQDTPDKPFLHIAGGLPNNCTKLRVVVAPPDKQKKIVVDVYTLVDANGICLPITFPFDQLVDFGKLSAGPFTVWVAGQQVGTIK